MFDFSLSPIIAGNYLVTDAFELTRILQYKVKELFKDISIL